MGTGLEWAFYPNVSAKLEYLYYDLGVANTSMGLLTHTNLLGAALLVVNASTSSTRFNSHVVRAGLNYHLDWGLPASNDIVTVAEKSKLGDWDVRLAPYAWANGLNGNQTLRGRNVNVNASFYDTLTNANHILVFMGCVEARNGPFSLYGDLVWARMGYVDSTLRQTNLASIAALMIGANGSLKTTLAFGEAWTGYEVARWRRTRVYCDRRLWRSSLLVFF